MKNPTSLSMGIRLSSVSLMNVEDNQVEETSDICTKEWVNWIRENLYLSVPIDEMHRAMAREGIDGRSANLMIEVVQKMKEFHPGLQSRPAEQKRSWILDSMLKNDQCGKSSVPVRAEIEPDQFYEEFYSTNTPLQLTDWVEYEHLRDRLSWDSLRETLGDQRVEIQSGRRADKHYERNSREHKEEVKFDEFLDQVTGGDMSNDLYLTANNGARNSDLFSSILNMSDWMPPILDSENTKEKAFLWIGPKGTVTPLHHDLTNNLLLQVKGEKVVRLFPPCYQSCVYNDFHCYSDFDCDNPDFEKFPRAKEIRIRSCVLREGQALFLPVGWWHQVRSLSPSISITAVNFSRPNEFSNDYTTYDAVD